MCSPCLLGGWVGVCVCGGGGVVRAAYVGGEQDIRRRDGRRYNAPHFPDVRVAGEGKGGG